ncbi:MAG: type II toxin-antitoxin system HicA family toxin [Clostridia bacterium]|nr:type II toxin-antitoxin system HicA family toxin [Clostridia bacterium]
MSKKEKLLDKISRKPVPRDFTVTELHQLMGLCGCEKEETRGGSSVKYLHKKTGQIFTIHLPHPGKELYIDIVRRAVQFLTDIGEL